MGYRIHQRDREQHPSGTTTRHQYDAFEYKLTDDAHAARAEADAHAELALTRDGSREQQDCDIEAGENHDASHPSGQGVHRRRVVLDREISESFEMDVARI